MDVTVAHSYHINNFTEYNTDYETLEEVGDDVNSLAQSYLLYKIGQGINVSYFPILVPVGVLGNILSFMVMVQPHNRHMSISLYISVLAVADTIALLLGFTTYLAIIHNVEFPPSHYWFCALNNTILFISTLCSTLFILSMTFDRFYSIIRPHKAASFNTVKRAKITIVCIVIFSIAYNVPHLFISSDEGKQCLVYGSAMDKPYGQFYYWLSFLVHFALPFISLLIMNSFIIHTLRKRFKGKMLQNAEQSQDHGHNSKMKSSEKQIFVILLLVTFAFLILTTPSYVLFLYVMFFDYERTPYRFAGFFLFHNVGQKTYYTNYGINFFLYVISGQKFRTDLINLFKCHKEKLTETHSLPHNM